MPLKSGSSPKTISSNISELHGGKTYAHTAANFGQNRANKQAVAIALSEARKGRAMGGPVAPPASGLAGVAGGITPAMSGNVSMAPAGLAAPALKRGGIASNRATGGFNPLTVPATAERAGDKAMIRGLTKGPILSAVPGRTDAHFTHVPSGSYVVPADIVSGRGEGNTIAGAHTLQKLFRMGPYGSGASPAIKGGAGVPRVRGGFPKVPKLKSGGGKSGHDAHVGKPVRVNLAGGEIVVPPENLMAVVHPNLKTAHEIMDAWVLKERKKLRKTLAKLPGPVKD